NVRRAIEIEAKRLIELVATGQAVEQQTRSFDATNGTTFSMRTKEEANDYRYFTDPDLPPFQVTDAFLQAIRASLPALPEQLIRKYTQELQLPEYDARILCDDRDSAAWFERLIQHTTNYKAAANWLLGPVRSGLNDRSLDWKDLPVRPDSLARLI